MVAQVQVDMGSVSKEAMHCLDAATKKFFEAHTSDYKEVRWSLELISEPLQSDTAPVHACLGCLP